MTAFRVLYRTTYISIVVITGCILTLFFQNGSMPRQGLSSKFTCWWHKKVTHAFGIPVRTFGTPCEHATLFVANHISWFDINAIGSVLPVRFLSKIEVKHTPVLGWLASRAGTLYIPRGHKTASENANAIMSEALQQDHHVVLFAEGTTGDGKIRRFHSRLIQSAINAGVKVQPVAIRYPYSHTGVHPAALFVGDTTMGESVKNIMLAKDLVAEIHFLEPVDAIAMSRDELAAYAEDKVREIIEHELTGN